MNKTNQELWSLRLNTLDEREVATCVALDAFNASIDSCPIEDSVLTVFSNVIIDMVKHSTAEQACKTITNSIYAACMLGKQIGASKDE